MCLALLAVGCSNGGGGNDSGRSVTGGNRAPVAVADFVAVDHDTSANIPVLANDTDPDGDILRILSVTAPNNGTAVIHDNGTATVYTDDYIAYTPESGFNGGDLFSYTIGDGSNGRASGVVSLSVAAAEATGGLTAVDDYVVTAAAAAIPVLANDNEANGVNITTITAPGHGVALIDDNGTPADPGDDFVTYVPAVGYLGPDSFLYSISNGTSSDTAAVNIMVDVAAPPMSMLCGHVMKGAVADAMVAVYRIDDRGERIGMPVVQTSTDSDGYWCGMLELPRQPMLVVSTGGLFVDESTAGGSVITLDAADELLAFAPAATDYVAVTVYSNALLEKARHETAGENFVDVFEANRNLWETAIGIDVVQTMPADPISPDPTSSAVSLQYAILLGGAANSLGRIASELGQPIVDYAMIRAMIEDLSDCDLDGADSDGPITLTVAGQPESLPDNIDLNIESIRYRNNNIEDFPATAVPQIDSAGCTPVPLPDTEPPSFTVIPMSISDPTTAGVSRFARTTMTRLPSAILMLAFCSSETAQTPTSAID